MVKQRLNVDFMIFEALWENFLGNTANDASFPQGTDILTRSMGSCATFLSILRIRPRTQSRFLYDNNILKNDCPSITDDTDPAYFSVVGPRFRSKKFRFDM